MTITKSSNTNAWYIVCEKLVEALRDFYKQMAAEPKTEYKKSNVK